MIHLRRNIIFEKRLMTMTDCIFCKIINKEIPSSVVYEDEKVLAFLDITQTTKGHTLVIPKIHVQDIFELSEETAADLFSRIPKIARAIEKSDPAIKGMNILNNNREAAYQTVFHSHVHLIPRYDDQDDFSVHFGNHMADYTAEDLQQIANQINKQMEE